MARHLARRVAKPRHLGRVPPSLLVPSGGRAAFGKANDEELGQGQSRGGPESLRNRAPIRRPREIAQRFREVVCRVVVGWLWVACEAVSWGGL
jgi:hypothetical protein